MSILAIGDLLRYRLGGAEAKLERLVTFWLERGADVTIAGMKMPDGAIRLRGRSVRTRSLGVKPGAYRIARGIRCDRKLAQVIYEESSRHDVMDALFFGEAALVVSVPKTFKVIDIPVVSCPAGTSGKGDEAFLESVPFWPVWSSMLRNQVERLQILTPARGGRAQRQCAVERVHRPLPLSGLHALVRGAAALRGVRRLVRGPPATRGGSGNL